MARFALLTRPQLTRPRRKATAASPPQRKPTCSQPANASRRLHLLLPARHDSSRTPGSGAQGPACVDYRDPAIRVAGEWSRRHRSAVPSFLTRSVTLPNWRVLRNIQLRVGKRRSQIHPTLRLARDEELIRLQVERVAARPLQP